MRQTGLARRDLAFSRHQNRYSLVMLTDLANNKEDAEKRYIEREVEFQKAAKERRESEPIVIENFVLQQTAGPIKLSECFEGKSDLIVIHNMGIHCSYCTMWADGINGVQAHLRDRAGLILVSGDSAGLVGKTAGDRDWKFPVAANADSGFFVAMGMDPDDTGEPWPGMSTFHLNKGDEIEHIATESFGPFDLFSPVWHFVGRLKNGVDGWEPKLNYDMAH